MSLNIVLFQPEIPANTGNIGRLCVGANATLHIIKPMRFLLNDKYLRRAGLDYWQDLHLILHDSWENFLDAHSQNNIYYCTTKSQNIYTQFEYKDEDFFVFGPESRGIPMKILEKNWTKTIKIPMSDQIRSINLANSVSIVLYEALRQLAWPNLN
ncbi:MAG TPA: tRNA (uridine(34)/cytosine(34)/5-carboxymethylaminomethyluridine(34)-2'-O)-methyltransferase TrmL [Candidatus Cloacimonas sp.]|nr:tRNA (cytidine/uridine-2-O-)-methyltransferase [Candidatus Cloacimonadota bacterium]HCX72935.1 tRNA (uridine(34)/cytosine(34)/5-carboxymethylaminomethyluridine(34)-2'-O)-methyltransferase TrmL [Candidatus Cloacimonas sp.]